MALIATSGVGVAHAEDPKPTSDANRVVCKRQLVTGSLVQAVKACHTREEWQLLGEQNREEGRRLQDQAFRQGTHG